MANDNYEIKSNLVKQIEEVTSEVDSSKDLSKIDFYSKFSELNTYFSYATEQEDITGLEAINNASKKIIKVLAEEWMSNANYREGFEKLSKFCSDILAKDKENQDPQSSSSQIPNLLRQGVLSFCNDKMNGFLQVAEGVGGQIERWPVPGCKELIQTLLPQVRAFTQAANENKHNLGLSYDYMEIINKAVVTALNKMEFSTTSIDKINYLKHELNAIQDVSNVLALPVLKLKCDWKKADILLENYYGADQQTKRDQSSGFWKVLDKINDKTLDLRKGYGATYPVAREKINAAYKELGSKAVSKFTQNEVVQLQVDLDKFLTELGQKKSNMGIEQSFAHMSMGQK